MNRFPVWKYALVALCVAVAFFYTLPNFFGESPAVQISSLRTAVHVDPALLQRVEGALAQARIPFTGAL
ncbi:MAG: protein translocase subunit SecD, partial [Burkholderiales bacterium]